MDEHKLDKEIRQFLKKVGIQSNQAIDAAIRASIDKGTLQGEEALNAVMYLKVPELDLEMAIAGTIALE